MSITAKTRKILWGRSGNRCAICKRELVIQRSANDPDTVVGDECHIVSKQEYGPRSQKLNSVGFDFDSYDNLLLLCKTHHKLIDDQPNKYSVEALQSLKLRHEEWIRQKLAGKKKMDDDISFQGITLLARISSGKELINIVKGAHLYRFDFDEPETQDEMELLGGFSQSLQDYGDILIDLDVSESIRAGFHLKQELSNLEHMGFLVFGERRIEYMEIGGLSDHWQVATVVILREGSPSIFNPS